MPKIEFFMTRRYFGKTLIYGVTGSEINNQWSFQLFSLDIGQATTTKIDMKKSHFRSIRISLATRFFIFLAKFQF